MSRLSKLLLLTAALVIPFAGCIGRPAAPELSSGAPISDSDEGTTVDENGVEHPASDGFQHIN